MTGSSHLRDDSALVAAVQAGDVAAYEELFRRHHTSVKRVCTRRLGNPVEADEVAQAAFVRAFERIDRCIGDRRFGAWVQVIARRLCVDMIRARTRTTPDDDPLRNERPALNVASDVDAGTATEEALARRERTARVHEALALLPDRQRAVVVARHLEGRRPPEIAAALGLSVGAVDSLLLRARRRLAVNYEHVLADGDQAAVSTASATAVSPAAVSASAAAAGPPRVGSVTDAVAGLVRDVAVALPAGASAVPAPVRRVVAAVVAAAVPAISAGPAPAAPPPPPATSAAAAPAGAPARQRLPGSAVPATTLGPRAAAAVPASGDVGIAGAPAIPVTRGAVEAAAAGLAALLPPQPAPPSAGTGAVVVPDLPPVAAVLATPAPAAAEPPLATPVPAAPGPLPLPPVPPLPSSPLPPVPVAPPPLPPLPAVAPAVVPPG